MDKHPRAAARTLDQLATHPAVTRTMPWRRRCLFLARRPQRGAGSSGQLLLRCVCAPVGRGEPGAAGGLRAAPFPGACARASAPGRRVVLRRRGPRIDRQRSRPLARYRRHISHGRRQAKARRQEARRQEAGRQKTGREEAGREEAGAQEARREVAQEARAGPRRPRFVFAPSIVLHAQAAKKSPAKKRGAA